VKLSAAFLFLASFILILGNLKKIISTTAPDFGVLWISAKDLLSAKNPYSDPMLYTPNAYPPVTELFFIPLALLPYQVGQAIFVFISFASVLAAIFSSIKIAKGKVAWPYFLAFAGLALFSFPTKYSLGMGQPNPLVLFLLLLAFLLESKNKSAWAGILLGVSIILKPIFLFFLLFFVLNKSWKTILVSLATILTAVVITLFFWSPKIWASWFKTGIVPLANLAGREVYVNQGLMGFVSRIFINLEIRKYLTGALSLLLIAIAADFSLMKREKNLVFSLFIITLLFIDSASWQHHFVWLIFPAVVLSTYIIKHKNAVLLGLLAAAYLLVSWNFKTPNLYPTVLLSNQFYGTTILWGINIYFLTTQIKTATTDKGSAKYKIFESLNFE
jgi:alpha-1,2-mannosyltransferase